MKSLFALVVGVVAAAGSSPLSPPVAAAELYQIPDLPGGIGSSYLDRVSSDGRVAVGGSIGAAGPEAVYWTPSEGLVPLGDLPGGEFGSYALAVSADGSVIVGDGTVGVAGVNSPFRWTRAGGLQSLGTYPGHVLTEGRAVSGDGRTVYGSSFTTRGIEAFRWTADTGLAILTDVPGGGYQNHVADASSDGSTVVGVGSGPGAGTPFQAARWDAAGALHLLGAPAGHRSATAIGVSPDGSFIVGTAALAVTNAPTAWIWTEAQGFTLIGGVTPDSYPHAAKDVSDTGTVVGIGTSVTGNWAFIWDAARGVRDLEEVLESDYGLDLAGLELLTANGISADGMTIVGTGRTPGGEFRGFVAVLPEPAGLLACAAAAPMMLRRGRRRPTNPGAPRQA